MCATLLDVCDDTRRDRLVRRLVGDIFGDVYSNDDSVRWTDLAGRSDWPPHRDSLQCGILRVGVWFLDEREGQTDTIYSLCRGSTLAGPPAAGALIRDAGGSYRGVMGLCGATSIVGGFLLLWVRFRLDRRVFIKV